MIQYIHSGHAFLSLPGLLWSTSIPVLTNRKSFRILDKKHSAVIAKINFSGLQRSAGHFEPLLDIFPRWWLANISGHSCCPYRTRSELSAGHQQKSAGHVRHVRHISQSLTLAWPACPAQIQFYLITIRFYFRLCTTCTIFLIPICYFNNLSRTYTKSLYQWYLIPS